DFSVLVIGVPHLRAVKATAVTASDFTGENAHTAMPVRITASSLHLLLYPVELCGWDDGFMVSFHIVLRHLALVLFLFLCQEVRCVNLLEKGIAFVLFVGKNTLDRFLAPVLFTARCRNTLLGELPRYRIRRFSLQEKSVNSTDDHRL